MVHVSSQCKMTPPKRQISLMSTLGTSVARPNDFGGPICRGKKSRFSTRNPSHDTHFIKGYRAMQKSSAYSSILVAQPLCPCGTSRHPSAHHYQCPSLPRPPLLAKARVSLLLLMAPIPGGVLQVSWGRKSMLPVARAPPSRRTRRTCARTFLALVPGCIGGGRGPKRCVGGGKKDG